MTIAREIHLASRPTGVPTPDNFSLVTVDLPEPGPGEVLIRNLVMSLDPFMRTRMDDIEGGYVTPFQIGKPLDGGAVGEVVVSNDPSLVPGDLVTNGMGWRDMAVVKASWVSKVDPALGASAHLGALGSAGFTAYVGLLDIAGMKPGDTVYISAAAGSVGGLVGQIAKLKGAARVIGSAGSAAKVKHLTDILGFDAAFNYKDAPVAEQLPTVAPDCIDVYFDNVGGDHLDAALGNMRPHGRVALCGAISLYNTGITEPPPGPRNLVFAIGNRLTVRGFIINDHNDRQPAFAAEMSGWITSGAIRPDETVVDGIEHAPQALIDLLGGGNIGKMIVRF